MRWYRFGTDFFACDCEKLKMYWMYIEFFGKKQAGKDVPKMCRRINQRFLKYITQTLILYLAHCKMNFHFPIDNTNDTTERSKCQYPLTDRTP